MPKIARHDFPPECYPLTIEALHPDTRKVVWSTTVSPLPGEPAKVEIPPLRRQLGHPVAMRIIFADGSVEEAPPVYEQ